MESRALPFHFFLLWTIGLCRGQHESSDPCQNYIELSEAWRQPHVPANSNCDTLAAGWYTFKLDKEVATIPTQCIQDNSCGTQVPLRVDLGGQQMPEVGQNITANLCGSFNVLGRLDCCVLRQEISIMHCPDGNIIYRLPRQDRCPVAVCAQKVSQNIPEEILAKMGDMPRSAGNTHRDMPGTTPPGDVSTRLTSAVATTQEQVIERTFGPVYLTSASLPSRELATTSPLRPASGSPGPEELTLSQGNSTTNNTVFTTSDIAAPTNATSIDGTDVLDGDKQTDNTTHAGEDGSGEDMTLAISFAGHPNVTQSSFTSSAVADITSKLSTAGPHTTKLSTVSSRPSSPVPRTSSSSDLLSTGTPTSTTVSGSSPQSTSAQTPGSTDSSSTSPESHTTPRPLSSGDVRFVLKGNFEEHAFSSTLLSFVNKHHQLLTGSHAGSNETFQEFHIKAETEMDWSNITVAHVVIMNPLSNTPIPAKTLVVVVEQMNFTHCLEMTGLVLVAVCPAEDNCDEDGAVPTGTASQALFERNLPVFIAVIVIAAVCLVALMLGLAYLRCSKRGTWVLSADHEEKAADHHMAVESPMTDSQIMQEERETALTANGDHALAPDSDIPAADEDNGWVVPIEQSPSAGTGGVAPKTEDTRF